jgi:glycosyltransferase involved in cell wall biosynthesis
MRKKIGLFLGTTRSMGGVYQYSQSLLDAVAMFPTDEFEVVAAYADPVWEPEIERYGLAHWRVPCPRFSFARAGLLTWLGVPVPWWRAGGRLVDPVGRSLRRAGCLLWLISSYSQMCYALPVPTIGMIHDLMHRYERFKDDCSLVTYVWRERVFKRICRWTAGVLVDSEIARNQVVESYGTDRRRIHVLPYVPPRYVYDAVAAPADFDRRCPLPATFIFYPAQFWQHKNHARLLRAVAALKPVLPDIHLALAGALNRGYEGVRGLVTELGLEKQVTFLGYVPDGYMPELYRRARAMVMPTFNGPTNIPPLEALALGCPLAVSGIYAMPDQVGDAGLLFDPRSVEAIAETIRRLWTDDVLCATLGARGRERASRWGRAEFARKLQAILDSVLDAGAMV